MPPQDRAPASHDVTALLQAWRAGRSDALDELIPIVYRELGRLARRHMGRERPGHTLQATALVNEVYIRLVDLDHVQWHDRAHFFAMAARLMRQLLVNMALAKRTQKRGGDLPRVTFDEALMVAADRATEIVALDEALETLEATDARKAQVVELRYFGGLTVEETAEALSISPETVMRDWKFAKRWLARELSSQRHSGG